MFVHYINKESSDAEALQILADFGISIAPIPYRTNDSGRRSPLWKNNTFIGTYLNLGRDIIFTLPNTSLHALFGPEIAQFHHRKQVEDAVYRLRTLDTAALRAVITHRRALDNRCDSR